MYDLPVGCPGLTHHQDLLGLNAAGLAAVAAAAARAPAARSMAAAGGGGRSSARLKLLAPVRVARSKAHLQATRRSNCLSTSLRV